MSGSAFGSGAPHFPPLKLMVTGAKLELLCQSGSKGLSSEGKFGWAAPEQLQSGSWAKVEHRRWDGLSHSRAANGEGQLHPISSVLYLGSGAAPELHLGVSSVKVCALECVKEWSHDIQLEVVEWWSWNFEKCVKPPSMYWGIIMFTNFWVRRASF